MLGYNIDTMTSRQQLEKVQQLMDFAQLSEKDSTRLLKAFNWDVNLALNNIYERQYHATNNTKTPKNYTQQIKAIFDRYRGKLK
ncbi:hypothetical protein A0J61_04067 [Choanephora cucurbitarum]|uniref:Uncharacterized protein n=1 Tax=Choanephora cucurbitarum TaxID=101091 RepID=A0A1C7NFI6_9FUNG|nr:hypothetical protein A0J61_04067 [Choanephora cucurbitarum]